MLRLGAERRRLLGWLGHLAPRVQAIFQLEPVWCVQADARQCPRQGRYAGCLHRQYCGAGASLYGEGAREQRDCQSAGPLLRRFWLQDLRAD